VKCARKDCDRSDDVVRFAPGIWLCLFHREAILLAAKAHEQKFKVDRRYRNAEARQTAVQAAGWAYPPEVRKVSSRVSEVSGGLPSLGKGQ
jgi:hypothetical protein